MKVTRPGAGVRVMVDVAGGVFVVYLRSIRMLPVNKFSLSENNIIFHMPESKNLPAQIILSSTSPK